MFADLISQICSSKKTTDMKRIISTLPLLMLSLCMSAQQGAAWRITYDCNALQDNARETTRWCLDIGSTTAVFYSPNYRMRNDAIESLQKTDDLAATLDAVRQIKTKYPGGKSLEILSGAPHPGEYTYINTTGFGDVMMYQEPLPEMDWELADSVRTVCGYECHEARAKVYGRSWTVWYATEIPLPYGPYVLGGLPGLILEASDSEGIFHFTAVGMETLGEEPAIGLYGEKQAVKCTRKQYLKLRKSNEDLTYGEAVQNLFGSASRILDENGNDISHEKTSKRENYLDLE